MTTAVTHEPLQTPAIVPPTPSPSPPVFTQLNTEPTPVVAKPRTDTGSIPIMIPTVPVTIADTGSKKNRSPNTSGQDTDFYSKPRLGLTKLIY